MKFKRILVCIPCLAVGGTEVQTLSLVEALIASGYEVVVVCYFNYADAMVERYRKVGAKVELLSADGVRPSGVKATFMHLYKGLRGVVKATRPDVAHVQYMAPGMIPILILRALGVKKIVATAHTAADIYSPKGLRLVQWLSKNVLTAFQCITIRAEKSFFGGGSLFGKSTQLKRRGNHFTIYNNLPSYIQIRETPKVFNSKMLTLGVVSRLEPIKGMDLVVPAFAELVKSYPKCRLLVVGDGSQRELMKQQSLELGVADYVTFVGRQGQDALQSYYDQIDVLMMPSRSEGFGLTAIEGMARGCVVIASDVGGLPEVVTEECGALFKSEDVADLVRVLHQEFNGDLPRKSACAIELAHRFSGEVYNDSIKELYNKILAL